MRVVTLRNGILEDIPAIQHIAEKSWWSVYRSILAPEQIEFMLHTIYSTASLTDLIVRNIQRFRILAEDDQAKGFLAYGPREVDPTIYKIHKLYVLPEAQGRGFGKMLIEDLQKRVLSDGISVVDLNVNRFNPAKSFYERMGFNVLHEEDVPIGPYWMNDFVMRMNLDPKLR